MNETRQPAARHPRRRLVLVSTVAVTLAATSGVALAASHDSPVSAGPASTYGAPRLEGGRPAGSGPGRSPVDASLGQVLHGDFVVLDRSSTGTTRKRFQTGTVTAVSTSSLTVRSSDGYVSAYTLSTKSGVTVGTKVTVTATLTGTHATATSVVKATQASAPAGQVPA